MVFLWVPVIGPDKKIIDSTFRIDASLLKCVLNQIDWSSEVFGFGNEDVIEVNVWHASDIHVSVNDWALCLYATSVNPCSWVGEGY